VPALRVVPDSVVSAHADPVGDGAVLALLLGQLLLDPEGLVGRHGGGGRRRKRRRRQRRAKPLDRRPLGFL